MVMMSSQAMYSAGLMSFLGSGKVITISSDSRELCLSISVSLRCLKNAINKRFFFVIVYLLVFSLSSCNSVSGILQPSIKASNSALVAASAFLVTSGRAVTVS